MTKTNKGFKNFPVSLHPEMIADIKEVTERLRLTSPSELFRNVWRDYYENVYRPKYMGYRGIDQGKGDKSPSMIDQVTEFEAMSDDDATKFIYDIGYVTENEASEKNFSIVTDGSNKVLRIEWKNGGGVSTEPFNTILPAIRKIIRKNNNKISK